MKENVIIIRLTGAISILTLIIIFIMQGIYKDISLAIFGSSLLACFTALINYYVGKIKCLENFYTTISERIHYYTEYNTGDNLNEKCKYFIEYYNRDFSDYGLAYSNIYFLFDFKNKNKKYIFNNIYSKCYSLSNHIQEHYWHFRYYVDGSGKNDKVIGKFIEEVEKEMEDFLDEVPKEMENKYYKIMYGCLKMKLNIVC